MFASLAFAGVLMVALATAQVTWFVGGDDHITAGLKTVSPAGGDRAVATKSRGPVDSPTALGDLSPLTNGASQATPG